MPTFTLARPRTFSLTASGAFYRTFVPGSGMAALVDDGLTFAFHLDGTFEPVAAQLIESGEELVVTHTAVADATVLAGQLARMLGLDVDAETFARVGRDPLVAKLRALYPGFHTAAKASPYDAATWGMIAPRLAIAAAAKIKAAVAQRHGTRVTLRGREHVLFPSPEQLLALPPCPELPAEKHARLVGIAQAALEGRLGAEELRMRGAAAMSDLQLLRGVGPWVAGHIYHRGAAPTDGLPTTEPRVAPPEEEPSVQQSSILL